MGNPYEQYAPATEPEETNPYAQYAKKSAPKRPAPKKVAQAPPLLPGAGVGAVVGAPPSVAVGQPKLSDILIKKSTQPKPAPKVAPPKDLKELLSRTGVLKSPSETDEDYASRIRKEDESRRKKAKEDKEKERARIQLGLGQIGTAEGMGTEAATNRELWSSIAKDTTDRDLEKGVESWLRGNSGLPENEAYERAHSFMNELRDRSGLLGNLNPKYVAWNAALEMYKLHPDPEVRKARGFNVGETAGAAANTASFITGLASLGAKDLVLDPVLKVLSPAGKLAATKIKGGLNSVVKKIEKSLSGDSVAEAVRIATKDLNLTNEQAARFQKELTDKMMGHPSLKQFIDANKLKQEAELSAEAVAQGRTVNTILGNEPQNLSDVVARMEKPPRESVNFDAQRKLAEEQKKAAAETAEADKRAAEEAHKARIETEYRRILNDNPKMHWRTARKLAEEYADIPLGGKNAGKISKNQSKPKETGQVGKRSAESGGGNVQQTTETGTEAGGGGVREVGGGEKGGKAAEKEVTFNHETSTVDDYIRDLKAGKAQTDQHAQFYANHGSEIEKELRLETEVESFIDTYLSGKDPINDENTDILDADFLTKLGKSIQARMKEEGVTGRVYSKFADAPWPEVVEGTDASGFILANGRSLELGEDFGIHDMLATMSVPEFSGVGEEGLARTVFQNETGAATLNVRGGTVFVHVSPGVALTDAQKNTIRRLSKGADHIVLEAYDYSAKEANRHVSVSKQLFLPSDVNRAITEFDNVSSGLKKVDVPIKGGVNEELVGTRFRHEDLENSADTLGIALPDKTKWVETWDDVERRALSNLDLLNKSLPSSHITFNEGLSKEQRYVAAQQLRSTTDKINTLVAHMEGKSDVVKEQLSDELDSLLKESERLSGVLYKSNSVAGRDLAYSKALIEGPFDEAGILLKAERLSQGTLTGKARTRLGGLASSGKKAQITAEAKIQKQAASALEKLRGLADVPKVTAQQIRDC